MTKPVRVLVVDDEPVARRGLVALLQEQADIEVAGECGTGSAAVEAIRRLAPQLVLLDVQMPDLDGFDVIAEVGPENMPAVIFVTAYDQYAVRAFEVNALDYLLKPFDDQRFREALVRARRAIAGGDAGVLAERLLALVAAREPESSAGARFLTRIVVRKPSGSLVVPVEEIDWIEAADYCVRIHAKQRVHVIRESMHRLEQRLDPTRFFRAHRSGIVNLDRVRAVEAGPRGDQLLLLDSGARVRLSRTRRAALEERLGQAL